jgi:hypothetical protein
MAADQVRLVVPERLVPDLEAELPQLRSLCLAHGRMNRIGGPARQGLAPSGIHEVEFRPKGQ